MEIQREKIDSPDLEDLEDINLDGDDIDGANLNGELYIYSIGRSFNV
jgi:hypothetical protein